VLLLLLLLLLLAHLHSSWQVDCADEKARLLPAVEVNLPTLARDLWSKGQQCELSVQVCHQRLNGDVHNIAQQCTYSHMQLLWHLCQHCCIADSPCCMLAGSLAAQHICQLPVLRNSRSVCLRKAPIAILPALVLLLLLWLPLPLSNLQAPCILNARPTAAAAAADDAAAASHLCHSANHHIANLRRVPAACMHAAQSQAEHPWQTVAHTPYEQPLLQFAVLSCYCALSLRCCCCCYVLPSGRPAVTPAGTLLLCTSRAPALHWLLLQQCCYSILLSNLYQMNPHIVNQCAPALHRLHIDELVDALHHATQCGKQPAIYQRCAMAPAGRTTDTMTWQ
jgi:hypothetical protein